MIFESLKYKKKMKTPVTIKHLNSLNCYCLGKNFNDYVAYQKSNSSSDFEVSQNGAACKIIYSSDWGPPQKF